MVASDGLDAGPGDMVLVAQGSRTRDLTLGREVPTKTVILAILDGGDSWDEGDREGRAARRSARGDA